MVLFRRGRFIRKPFVGKGIVQPFQQLSQAADGAACFTVAEGKRPRFAEKQFTRRLTAEADATELDGLASAVFDDLEKTRMESADIAEDIVPDLADELAQAIRQVLRRYVGGWPRLRGQRAAGSNRPSRRRCRCPSPGSTCAGRRRLCSGNVRRNQEGS